VTWYRIIVFIGDFKLDILHWIKEKETIQVEEPSMAQENCAACPLRAKYDNNPKSLLGRFWRWHITFCPGWKKYMGSLDESDVRELKDKYNIK
jgi:hypothetical protein